MKSEHVFSHSNIMHGNETSAIKNGSMDCYADDNYAEHILTAQDEIVCSFCKILIELCTSVETVSVCAYRITCKEPKVLKLRQNVSCQRFI